MPARLLVHLVARCALHARAVAAGALLLGLLAGWLAHARLGVTTDVGGLFAASLPWKQREAALGRDFPQNSDLLVCVIDAAVPEEADATAAALAAALAPDRAHVRSVRRPDASPYFDTEGLLFLDRPELERVLNGTIDAQPFLGQLVADPSARGLFAALSLVGMGVEKGVNLAPFEPALRGFHQTLAAAADGHAQPLSWQRLLSGSLADRGGPYRFVLVKPVLNYGALQPGEAATQAVREAAAGLEFVRAGTARVRITGSVALADEEFASVAQGALAETGGSVVLVVLWLFLALRSWRLIVPVVLTLLLGLVLTTGFAAATVGTLNLISVAFAVLFVGIAVDFAIQFTVRFREMRLGQPAISRALAATAARAGVQVLIASAATAAGFLAFVPTSFVGVAQLGLIAGVGMLIAFLCTVTALPALLALFRPRGGAEDAGFPWARPLDAAIARRRRAILLVFALLALAGLASVPRLRFDSDPLHTKNPNTEAMRTLADLVENPLTNPYSIDIMTPDVPAAEAVAARVRPLPLVDEVMTLASFVPADQGPKLALVADAAGLLDPTLAAGPRSAPVSAADIRLAIRTALSGLGPAVSRLPAGHPLAAVAGDLRRLQGASDEALLAMNAALTRFLPMQLDRLRAALSARPVTIADVPPEIARDWVTPDGRARVQVTATAAGRGTRGLPAFVDQVTAVVPDAGGSAVTITATARTIIDAFRHAVIGALLAITVILFAALRSARDVALVLAPLLLSAALTVLAATLLPLTLNFANVIALPLLLGVGVSFNIYFVMNWRAGEPSRLASPTARAVVFSALTTGTAFGSLALSHHPGTASMGELLLLSLGCTLAATLVFVPAALASLRPPGR